jgi:hypothetical protein
MRGLDLLQGLPASIGASQVALQQDKVAEHLDLPVGPKLNLVAAAEGAEH